METFSKHGKSGWFRRALAMALATLALGSTAQAWWNGEWTLRKKIVIDTSTTGANLHEATGPVPVLIRLYDGNFRFANAKPDGSDLRFFAEDDKTPLAYHIEKLDPLLNEAFVWVKVPDLKPGTKTNLWLYYGNAGPKATKAEDSKGTFDENTVLVYHFSEHGQAAYDSTTNGNNALGAGTAGDGALIGTGLRLDGKTMVSIPASASPALADGAPLTWSAWIRPAMAQPNAAIYSLRDNNGRGLLIGLDNGIPFASVTDAAGTQRTSTGAVVAPATWAHLAVTVENRKVTLYLNGEVYGSATASLPALNVAATLGGDGSGAAGYAGEIDELQISKTARPAGAIKLAVAEQGSDFAKVLSFGEDEQQTSWLSGLKTGYVGVIIGSLTIDGWVVIGVLAVMSAISWTIMVKKGLHLRKISQGNGRFLAEWSHVANDLSVLENEEPDNAASMGGRVDSAGQKRMRNSPIYRIYHIGTGEIAHRIQSNRRNGTKVLSARSMQAIRASLDGGLVRENQKLSSSMVLLTIAISGGPFLGLLGTVVGVMITFAAVAQAGEVNVNAIAPGIAAALAATVAGLAVAIPALFGYNYLLTKIKGETAEMHVFIDEFVAKMAEFYSEPAPASTPSRSPFTATEA